MPLPRSSLGSFLTLAKTTLHRALKDSQKVTLVIGNESADLDSIASSIVYSYLRSSTSPSPSKIYIPIANLPSADIRLRPEFLALLPHANIECSHIITLDDIPPPAERETKLKPENTRWILVDHNALQGLLGDLYGARVQGAIDHHDDEMIIPLDTGDEPRIVEKCGSCASLVTNHCREAWDQLSTTTISSGAIHGQGDVTINDNAVSKVWDGQLAKLALGPILIDTSNLKSKSKTTAEDIKAVEYLEAKIALSPQDVGRYSREAFFRELDTAKRNIDPLSTKDIFRKDYKEWREKGNKKLGISSVIKTLSWQLDHAKTNPLSQDFNQSAANYLSILREHAHERNLSICAVMTSPNVSQGRSRRELLLWVLDPECLPVADYFSAVAKQELGLESWGDGVLDLEKEGSEWRRAWWQNEAGKSRKQVAPLLRRCMNDA